MAKALAKAVYLTGFEWWELISNEGILSADDAWDIFERSRYDTLSSNEVFDLIINWEGGLTNSYQIKHIMSVLYSIDFDGLSPRFF